MTLSAIVRRWALVIVFSLLLIQASLLAYMGQPWLAESGVIKLWHGVVLSSENSQHLSDWYTPSHIIHGFAFYFVFAYLFRKRFGWIKTLWGALIFSMVLEIGWEILENTDWVINRYRETTISLDYFGDSILNSVSDTVAMIVGFIFAARAPVWLTVFLTALMEVIVGYSIRDNLTLNIIMLLHPFESILLWQSGG